MSLSKKQSETIALMALAFIAADEEALLGFLRLTGVTLSALKAGADRPDVLAGVLRFLMEREDRLTAFCANSGLDPSQPGLAFSCLEQHVGNYGYQDLN